MIRKLTIGEVAEFEPPTTISVAFSDQEIYTFEQVVKVLKEKDGTLYVEFADTTFAEIKYPYKLFKIGSEIESD